MSKKNRSQDVEATKEETKNEEVQPVVEEATVKVAEVVLSIEERIEACTTVSELQKFGQEYLDGAKTVEEVNARMEKLAAKHGQFKAVQEAKKKEDEELVKAKRKALADLGVGRKGGGGDHHQAERKNYVLATPMAGLNVTPLIRTIVSMGISKNRKHVGRIFNSFSNEPIAEATLHTQYQKGMEVLTGKVAAEKDHKVLDLNEEQKKFLEETAKKTEEVVAAKVEEKKEEVKEEPAAA